MTEEDRTERDQRIREMEGSHSQTETEDRESDDAAEAPDADTLERPGDEANTETDHETSAGEAGDDPSDDDEEMHIPGRELDDVDVDVEELARQAGVDTQAEESGVDGGVNAGVAGETDTESKANATDGAVPAGQRTDAEAATATMRVLEFDLGGEHYCLDIEYIEEIVKQETVTRVPNTPEYVEGVVDLRGQITTILNPKVPLDIEGESGESLILVFDPEEFDDQGAIGWIVDDVRQVTPLREDEINEPPIDDEHVNGVFDRDDEFVIWTSPDIVLDEAAG